MCSETLFVGTDYRLPHCATRSRLWVWLFRPLTAPTISYRLITGAIRRLPKKYRWYDDTQIMTCCILATSTWAYRPYNNTGYHTRPLSNSRTWTCPYIDLDIELMSEKLNIIISPHPAENVDRPPHCGWVSITGLKQTHELLTCLCRRTSLSHSRRKTLTANFKIGHRSIDNIPPRRKQSTALSKLLDHVDIRDRSLFVLSSSALQLNAVFNWRANETIVNA